MRVIKLLVVRDQAILCEGSTPTFVKRVRNPDRSTVNIGLEECTEMRMRER